MSLPWTESGVFDRESRSYIMDRIPRPPEARAIVESDQLHRESVVGYEIKVGCSKCFNQTIVRWCRAYSDYVIEDAQDGNPEILAVTVARQMRDVAARAELDAVVSRRREAEASDRARTAEAAFRKIQIRRSIVKRRKERKRRSKNKGKDKRKP